MGQRRSPGGGSIRLRVDGRYEATVHRGYGPDGKRLRRSFYGKTRRQVQAKLRGALTAHGQGLPVTGDEERLDGYLMRWVEESARPNLRPSTYVGYRMILKRHLCPGLGHHRLAKLQPQHVQAYLHLTAKTLAPRTVQYHHAVLWRALGEAERWGLVVLPRNVVHRREAGTAPPTPPCGRR